jgi:hypothetical protein
MTKTELLNAIINITRETGQGLTGVLIRAKGLGDIVDELIEEGKITSTIDRYNHLPDDEWLLPVGCYNMWKDDVYGKSGNGWSLTFIRMYLGIDDLGLGMKPIDALKNVDLMKGYSKWLEQNGKGLIALVNLKDAKEENPKEIVFSKEELDWIETRGWYQKNDKVSEALKASLEKENSKDDEKEFQIHQELLSLYTSDDSYRKKYAKDIVVSEKFIADYPKLKKMRSKLNRWLESQPQTKKIQDVFGKKKVLQKQ